MGKVISFHVEGLPVTVHLAVPTAIAPLKKNSWILLPCQTHTHTHTLRDRSINCHTFSYPGSILFECHFVSNYNKICKLFLANYHRMCKEISFWLFWCRCVCVCVSSERKMAVKQHEIKYVSDRNVSEKKKQEIRILFWFVVRVHAFSRTFLAQNDWYAVWPDAQSQ